MNTQPRRILIHAGHGKTGSSFLQAMLANSAEVLAAHAIGYPIAPKTAAEAKAGRITSGNINPEREGVPLLSRRYGGEPTLLFSNETFFNKMRPSGFLDRLAAEIPGAEVELLLYIRDPLDHAVSQYQQAVKRSGVFQSLEMFLDAYRMLERIGPFIAFVERRGVKVTVRNYSRLKQALQGSFEAWLAVPEGSLTPVVAASVNRSMTNAELALQMAFSRHFGSASSLFVSDPLCERLPGIAAELPPIGREGLERFLDRARAQAAAIDFGARLPAGEGYRVPTLEEAQARFAAPAERPTYTFTAEQLDVVAEAISAILSGDKTLEKVRRRAETSDRKQNRRLKALKGGRAAAKG